MKKTKIIPTIFATDALTFNTKLHNLRFAPSLHLDFMDGKFTDRKSVSFSEMLEVKKYFKTHFDVHLMAYEPIKYLDKIKDLGIKKVLIHYEVFEKEKGLRETIAEFKKNKIEVFLVFNPKTDVKKVINLSELIDGVMLMSVWPGKEGQEFIEDTYLNIEFLRRNLVDLDIQVDGGIKDTNIRKIIRKGANLINVGSFVSSAEKPKDAYDRLIYLIR